MPLFIVVLALLWVVFLGVPFLRARSEGKPSDSISAFRAQLTTLRRTHPHAARGLVPDRPRAHAYSPGAGAPVTSLASRRSMAVAPSQGRRPVAPQALAVAGLPTSRARTLRRRRDVFVFLLGACGVTLVLAVLVGARAMIYLQLLTDVLLGAYVTMLIRQRGVRAEADMKVRFLPGPAAPLRHNRPATLDTAPYRRAAQMEPALYRRTANMEPALLRRSAT